MFPMNFMKLFLVILLLSACNEAASVKIKIYTAGLGAENENYPQDIIDLWSVFTIDGKQVAPLVELERIDQSEEIFLTDLDQGFNLIPPDPEVKLDREKEALKSKKIDTRFSLSKPSSIDLAKQRIPAGTENVFFLKSNISNGPVFNSASELLVKLKEKIALNQGVNQEYVVVYNIVDQRVLEAKNAEILKVAGVVKTSKQSADNAAVSASAAAEVAQNSLRKVKGFLPVDGVSLSQFDCSEGRIFVSQMESYVRMAEDLTDKAAKAAKNADFHRQESERYANEITLSGASKPTVDAAITRAAEAADAAVKHKQQAELAADDAVELVEHAMKVHQRFGTKNICNKGGVKENIGSGFTLKKRAMDQEDELGAIKRDLHRRQRQLEDTYIRRN